MKYGLLLLISLIAVASATTVITQHDIYMDGQSISEIFYVISYNLENITKHLPKITSDGSALCEQVLYDKIRNGQAFSVSHRFENVGSGENVTMYFSVPSNGVTVTIVAIEVVTTAKGSIDIYRYPDVITAGTQITPINLNFGSSNASSVVVGYGYTVDLSSATKAHETVAPGGTRIRAIGSLSEVGERVLLPPGNSFIVVYENTDSAAEDVSIRIIWYEETGYAT